jgi:hypothetical protein
MSETTVVELEVERECALIGRTVFSNKGTLVVDRDGIHTTANIVAVPNMQERFVRERIG